MRDFAVCVCGEVKMGELHASGVMPQVVCGTYLLAGLPVSGCKMCNVVGRLLVTTVLTQGVDARGIVLYFCTGFSGTCDNIQVKV